MAEIFSIVVTRAHGTFNRPPEDLLLFSFGLFLLSHIVNYSGLEMLSLSQVQGSGGNGQSLNSLTERE